MDLYRFAQKLSSWFWHVLNDPCIQWAIARQSKLLPLGPSFLIKWPGCMDNWSCQPQLATQALSSLMGPFLYVSVAFWYYWLIDRQERKDCEFHRKKMKRMSLKASPQARIVWLSRTSSALSSNNSLGTILWIQKNKDHLGNLHALSISWSTSKSCGSTL